MARTCPIVLILSPDPEFARDLAAAWPANSNPPEFTVLDRMLAQNLGGRDYDLAIADASSDAPLALRQVLAATGKPVLLIHANDALPFLRTDGVMIEVCRSKFEGNDSRSRVWAEVAGVLGREILRRTSAEERLQDAETSNAAVKTDATLGRYMMEMRHNVNNVLTSVLGNAELLTLDPGLSRKALEQAEVIRNMALRLNEVFRRFSSLEKELSVAAREVEKTRAHAAGAH
jgi:signal transduction histidine kinase